MPLRCSTCACIGDTARETSLRTWLALGARIADGNEIQAIPWQDWQNLRDELRQINPLAVQQVSLVDPDWHQRQIARLGHRNQWDATLWHYDRLLEINSDADLLLGRAATLQRAGRHADAIADFQRVLDLQSESLTAQLGRVESLLQLKQSDEAMKVLLDLASTPDRIPENRRAELGQLLVQTALALGDDENALLAQAKNGIGKRIGHT